MSGVYKDCNGQALAIGNRVGVGFSSGRGSQGNIRTGEILFLGGPDGFVVLWDHPPSPGGSRVSPKLAFNAERLVKL